MLRVEPEAAAATEGSVDSPASDEAPPAPDSASAAAETPAEAAWEGEAWSQYGTPRRHNGGDGEFDFSDITPANLSLRDHLLAQSKWLATSPRDRALMATIIV